MPDTATSLTGADQAATELAERLRAAGWEVRITRSDIAAPLFSDGTPMYASFRNVFVHADGPASIGRPYLHLCWTVDYPSTDDAAPVKFSGDILMRGHDDRREFTSETEFAAWLDALIAVTAALDA